MNKLLAALCLVMSLVAPQAWSQATPAPAHVLNDIPRDAWAGETYYVTFFAYQRGANVFDKESSHSMALFTRVAPSKGQPAPVENVTISWMPAAGVVRAFAPAEPGQLTDLDFELRRGGAKQGARGFVWGPYRVPAVVFQRAQAQKRLLLSGAILYKAAGRDPASRNTNYIADPKAGLPQFLNCLAAVGDVAPQGGTNVGSASGQNGTRILVQHFAPWFVSANNATGLVDRHRWVAQQLNLGRLNAYFKGGLELEEVKR